MYFFLQDTAPLPGLIYWGVYLGQDEVMRNAFRRQERCSKMTDWTGFSAHWPQCERVHTFMTVTYLDTAHKGKSTRYSNIQLVSRSALQSRKWQLTTAARGLTSPAMGTGTRTHSRLTTNFINFSRHFRAAQTPKFNWIFLCVSLKLFLLVSCPHRAEP